METLKCSDCHDNTYFRVHCRICHTHFLDSTYRFICAPLQESALRILSTVSLTWGNMATMICSPTMSAVVMRLSLVSRSRIYNQIPKRFIHDTVGLTSKSLRTNTAASLGRVHFCPTRTSSTASAPSAVGFDNYDHGVKHFKLPVPEYFNFASDVVDLWAEKEASIIGRSWHFHVRLSFSTV